MSKPEDLDDNVSFSAQLGRVRKAIQKATKDALMNAQSSEPSLRDTPGIDTTHDPNASFHLGVELFGQEVGAVERHARETLSNIENELNRISERVQDQSEDGPGSSPSALKTMNKDEETAQLRSKIRFLTQCSSARSLLDESMTHSTASLAASVDLKKSARLQVQAGAAIKEARTILTSERNPSPSALAAANKILDSLRSDVRRQKVFLLAEARKCWSCSISLRPNFLSVRRSAELSSAYDVLEIFGDDGHSALQDIIRRFVASIHDTMFRPILQRHEACAVSTLISFNEPEEEIAGGLLTISSTKNSPKVSTRRLEWKLDSTSTPTTQMNSVDAWKNTIDFIQKTLSFIADHVLLERESLCLFAGAMLFGKPDVVPPEMLSVDILGIKTNVLPSDKGVLRVALMDTLEQSSIPLELNREELSSLQKISSQFESFLAKFHETLVAKNLVSGQGVSYISSFASRFEKLYVEKRRCTLLNKARNVLLNNDYHNTIEVGVDVKPNPDDKRLGLVDGQSVFKLQKCCISDTAYQILLLCRKTMEEAVTQDAQGLNGELSCLPGTLYLTARDILDLFRAIIPVTHGREVANVPRTAAVFHNDGVFLAHNCLSLGLEYRERFHEADDEESASSLRKNCMFVDMVPLFRDVAERSMGDMLDLQGKQLFELVGDRITMLGESLRSDDIVSEWSDAETAISAGLYHLTHLSKAWRSVLAYEILTRSLGYLADVIFSLLLQQVTKASDISSSACQFVNAQFGRLSNEIAGLVGGDTSGSQMWQKFSAVGAFMDMSLADIESSLSEGVFRSVSGPELSHLVRACFDDSPKRMRMLKLLSTSS